MPRIAGVRIAPEEVSLEIGQTGRLEATVEGEGEFDPTVVWSSTNEDVATVSDGVVQALSEGTAEIVAASAAAPHHTARAVVRVVPKPETTGRLLVTFENLPGGVDADIEVTGPAGFRRRVARSILLEDLVPGDYTVAARAIPQKDFEYVPVQQQVSATVEADGTAEVAIEYRARPLLASVTVPQYLVLQAPLAVTADVIIDGRSPGGDTPRVTISASNYMPLLAVEEGASAERHFQRGSPHGVEQHHRSERGGIRGAFYNDLPSYECLLVHVTIADNRASSAGGLFILCPTYARGSILARNTTTGTDWPVATRLLPGLHSAPTARELTGRGPNGP